MSGKVLTQFVRDYETRDAAEQVADASLYSLRMMCGRRAKVEVVDGPRIQEDEVISTSTRVAWGFFYVLLSGVTVPMTLVGAVALNTSDSYSRVYGDHLKGSTQASPAVRGAARDADRERALKADLLKCARAWHSLFSL